MRRIIEIVLFCGLVALAPSCSRRSPSSADDAGGGPGTDAASGIDIGPRDTGVVIPDVAVAHDTNVPTDSHSATDAAHDSATTSVDAHIAPMCPTAIDVSAGGMFTLDTCAGTDHFTSACGTTGTHDVIISATEMGSSTGVAIVGDTGWLIQQLTSTCTPAIGGTLSCSSGGMWNDSGSDGSPRFYFGIERVDGSCESVQIMVTRTP